MFIFQKLPVLQACRSLLNLSRAPKSSTCEAGECKKKEKCKKGRMCGMTPLQNSTSPITKFLHSSNVAAVAAPAASAAGPALEPANVRTDRWQQR